MNARKLIVALACGALAAGLTACSSQRLEAPASGVSPDQIKGDTYRLERAYLVTVHVPNADVDKVLESVVTAVGLDYGKYDQVAYLDAPGLEQYRPRAGSKGGAQSSAVREPTTNVSFSIPRDAAVLRKALDAAYKAHSYEEPVMYVSEIWRSRATNPDETNPNRWWNRKPQ